MVVRCEVDAYIEPPPPPTSSSQDTDTSQPGSPRSQQRRGYADDYSSTDLPTTSSSGSSQSVGLVKVIQGGILIPQSNILEIKSCALQKILLKKSGTYPQLFFSQTPHLYIGGHVHGVFSEIMKNDVSKGDFARQHDALVKYGALKKLIVALREIQELVRKKGKAGGLTLIFEKKTLRVYQRDAGSGGSLLPADILKRFNSRS